MNKRFSVEAFGIRFEVALKEAGAAGANDLVLVPEWADPCSIVLSLLYAMEDRHMGSKVRKDGILIAMNLLGLSQIKDVLETLREHKTFAEIRRNGGDAMPAPCRPERLFEITRGRLSRL